MGDRATSHAAALLGTFTKLWLCGIILIAPSVSAELSKVERQVNLLSRHRDRSRNSTEILNTLQADQQVNSSRRSTGPASNLAEITSTLKAVGTEKLQLTQLFQEASPQAFPNGSTFSAEYWGLTRRQLAEFREACVENSDGDGSPLCKCSKPWDKEAWNMHDVVDNCVMPTTKGSDLGLAMYFQLKEDRTPKKVNLMISHAWTENAWQFFEDLLEEMEDDEEAFICSFAVDQWRKGCQVGDNPLSSPFTTAIRSAADQKGRLLVIPNDELKDQKVGLYSRVWCVLELYYAWTMRLAMSLVDRAAPLAAEYLFGGGFDNRTHSTRNIKNAPQSTDLEKIMHIIKTIPPVASTVLSQAAAVHPKRKASQLLVSADVWSQLDFIAAAMAIGNLEEPDYDPLDIFQDPCLVRAVGRHDKVLVPCGWKDTLD